MIDLGDISGYEFFKPLVEAWKAKLEGSRTSASRKKWKEVSDEILMFYSRSAAAMWDPLYQKKFWSNIKAPKFRITINKAYEYVAIFGPNLIWDIPFRTVRPKRRLQIPPEAFPDEQLYQQIQAQLQQERTSETIRANLLQQWLNYTPREMPGGGLERHNELAVVDAMLMGRGTIWPQLYSFPGSQKTLTGCFRKSPCDLLIDPDAKTLQEAKWISLTHTEQHWEVERRFKLPKNSLKGKSNVESSWNHGELMSREDGGSGDRQSGKTGDLIVWHEVWSKMGVGSRMTGMPDFLKTHLEELVGDYAYLAICAECPYPLNCPADKIRMGAPDAEVKSDFEWPIPFWRDDRWPFECHDSQTEVLTKDGWKLFSELDGQELLATVDLNTDTIEYQKPTKLIAHRRSGEMIRFSGRQKLDALVTPGHRMVVYPAHSIHPVIKLAKDILPSDRLKMAAKNWTGKPCELPEFAGDTTPEDFAEWLGFYIAEGCCTNKKVRRDKGCSWQVQITQKKPEGRVYYEALAARLPFKHHPHRRGQYVISSKALWQYLKPLGNAYTKRVPQWVKDAPQSVIKAFLRGYVAGDGHYCKANGQVTSTTASRILADDIQELWLKSGKSASIRDKEPQEYCFIEGGRERRGMSGLLHVVGVRERTKASIKTNDSVLFSSESGYDDMVYCATVPNGTLITRRNGKTLISGNCLDFYPDPESAWPVPPLAPAMGELKFLNFLIPWLCNRIYSSSRDFWAVVGSHLDEYKKTLNDGEDQCVFPVPPGTDDVRKHIMALQQPETRADAWRIVELVTNLFDKRTGLTEFAYGQNEQGTQDRTAETTKARAQAVGVRPEYMQKKVLGWQSQLACMEGYLAQRFISAQDTQPLMGSVGGLLWQQYIENQEEEDLFRQMEFTIEAASIRRPNRDKDMAALQESLDRFLPVVQAYGQLSGDFTPANGAMDMVGDLLDMEMDKLHIPAKDPDSPEAQMQQQMQQAEAMKLMAEAQKAQSEAQNNPAQLKAQELQMEQANEQQRLQMELQKMQAELQAKMAEMQAKIDLKKAELQMKAQEHAMDMQFKAQEGQVDLAVKREQGAQQIAMGNQQIRQQEQRHAMTLQQQQEAGSQKVRQSREQTQAKIESTAKTTEAKVAATKAVAKAKPKAAK